MKLKHFEKFTSSFDTRKIIGGNCTFTVCTSDTNDPQYACGDEKKTGTKDDGTEYMNEVNAKECIPA